MFFMMFLTFLATIQRSKYTGHESKKKTQSAVHVADSLVILKQGQGHQI